MRRKHALGAVGTAIVLGTTLNCGNSDSIVSVNEVPDTLTITVQGSLVSVGELILNVGDTASLVATALNALGLVVGEVPISWSSTRPSIAFVSSTGLARAIAPGTSVISATGAGLTATMPTAVRDTAMAVDSSAVAEVTVSPSALDLFIGGEASLTATAWNSFGEVLSGTQISWTSSNTPVAAVSAAGIVTAIGVGTANVFASSGQMAAIAIINVETLDTLTEQTVQTTNEPPGFVEVVHETWNDPIDRAWGIFPRASPANSFTTPFGDGDEALTYVIPSDYTGDGRHTGAAYVWWVTTGPVLYSRAVVGFSSNWVGHSSGINKMFYHFNKGLKNGTHFLIADGSGTNDLFLRWAWVGNGLGFEAALFMWNGQFGGPGDGTFSNAASPTRGEAVLRRGEKVVIEQLMSYGTVGNSDGWFKIWMNGVLTHDYSGLSILNSVTDTDYELFQEWQIAPVYGGRGANDGLPSPDQRFWVFDVYLSRGNR